MYGGIGLALQLGGNLLFFLVLLCTRGQFPSTSPPPPGRAYIWRGDLTEGYEFGGLIFGGAYTWRGLFSEIYGIPYNAVLDYSHTYKFSNVKVLAKVFHVDNNMGSLSGKEKLVESKTRY